MQHDVLSDNTYYKMKKYSYQENNAQSGTPRKSRRKLVYAIIITALIVTIGYFANQWNSSIKIKSVDIIGCAISDKAELFNIVSPLVIEKSKKSINLQSIESSLSSNPFIYRVVASFEGISTLRINVFERRPVGMLVGITGSINLIDSSCHILPYQIFPGIESIPIFRDSGINRINLRMIELVKQFLGEDRLQLYHQISEVYYDKKLNSYCLILQSPFCTVLMGNYDGIETRIENLTSFYFSVIQKEQIKARSIDLRFKNKIITS